MQQALFQAESENFQKFDYKFIDLFAGIGGFHLALSRLGMKCVFASEIDKDARSTYLQNHHIDKELFNDDIRSIESNQIPDHDILCAGFPCQPFSQAGYKKGFEDGENSERGNLFFSIVEILEAKRPKAFILENVRHLLNHDNGKTFKKIHYYLSELNYSVDYKIIKASDFGRPQHRPRIYIVGFDKKQVKTDSKFEFPIPIPLKITMSDIWNANCDREIGFTLRVGGRGSSIDDRRNWDAYRVNGEVKQLMPEQGKKMMGFPEDFILPKSKQKAMKQLGNSVCVDVVQYIANEVGIYLNKYQYSHKELMEQEMKTFNKGEWSEIYVFFKIILEQKLPFCDIHGNSLQDCVAVVELAHKNSDLKYAINNSKIKFKSVDGSLVAEHNLSDLIDSNTLNKVFSELKKASGSSFTLPSADNLIQNFSVKKFKGTSFSKGDIDLTFNYNGKSYSEDPLGIKSYVGSPPTLLNSSGATNFIYEVVGFNGTLDSINSLEPSKGKIRQRILSIIEQGGSFRFVKLERKVHEDNLKLVDSNMHNILADCVLAYYSGKGASFLELIDNNQQLVRIKDYLKAVMLGMFSTEPWNGNYSSNGTVICDEIGKLSLIHVIKDNILKDYLLHNTKLDTPSSTKFRFGTLYKEGGKTFIKLNLQIRMK